MLELGSGLWTFLVNWHTGDFCRNFRRRLLPSKRTGNTNASGRFFNTIFLGLRRALFPYSPKMRMVQQFLFVGVFHGHGHRYQRQKMKITNHEGRNNSMFTLPPTLLMYMPMWHRWLKPSKCVFLRRPHRELWFSFCCRRQVSVQIEDVLLAADKKPWALVMNMSWKTMYSVGTKLHETRIGATITFTQRPLKDPTTLQIKY